MTRYRFYVAASDLIEIDANNEEEAQHRAVNAFLHSQAVTDPNLSLVCSYEPKEN